MNSSASTPATTARFGRRGPRPPLPRHGWRLTLPPGWPFISFFVGYPFWWLLGVTVPAGFAAASVMVVHLCRKRDTIVPKYFGLWLLFLAWVGAGAFLVQVNAPGAVPGASMTRYLTWGYRVSIFAVATVMLLYLCTFRHEMSWQRISRAMAWMFIYIVVGGLLGVIAPFFQFPSILELLLPAHVAHQPFVNSLVHPNLAQIQEYLGVITTRPSAPFPYANDWGLNYACFLPFFIMSWWHDAGIRRRITAVTLLAASSVPLVYSLDRAAWGAVAALGAFIALRGAMRGNIRLTAACLVLIGLGGGAILATPLGDTVQTRLSGEKHDSNEGRTNLGVLTASSALQGSPVAGFGTTRDVQGSFRSIAVGSTPSCPGCSGPALGTQGIVWLLIFAFGFGGFSLYIGFFSLHFIKSMRARAPNAALSTTVLLAYLFTSPFYDLGLTSQVAAFTAVALISNAPAQLPGRVSINSQTNGAQLSKYSTLARRQWRTVLILTSCGALVGVGWQHIQGVPYTGTAAVVIGTDTPGRTRVRPMSLDTAAQLANGSNVKASIEEATHGAGAPLDTSIQVSAAPNTRILKLSYTARTPHEAERVVSAAAASLLQMRSDALHSQMDITLRSLDSRGEGLINSIAPLSSGIRVLTDSGSASPLRQQLVERRASVYEELADIQDDTVATQAQVLDAGRVLQSTHVSHDDQRWVVAVVSGGLLGLLLSAVVAVLLEARSPRLRKAIKRQSHRSALPPIITSMAIRADGPLTLAIPPALRNTPNGTYLAVGAAPEACAAAELVAASQTDRDIPNCPQEPTVTLFATARCRTREVRAVQRSLLLHGTEVCCLVVVNQASRNKAANTDT